LKVTVPPASALPKVYHGGYLVGFNLVCGCVHTYVYGKRKGESKLHVFCSCLSTGLIIFDDQSGPD